jgi:hypothetical protein
MTTPRDGGPLQPGDWLGWRSRALEAEDQLAQARSGPARCRADGCGRILAPFCAEHRSDVVSRVDVEALRASRDALLEAARWAHEWMKTEGHDCGAECQVRAAIVKAEGK